MKNKTYYNFLRVWNYLQREKHYDPSEAAKLAHLVFDNVDHDRGHGDRPAEYFMARILSADEYRREYKEATPC